MFVCVCVCVSVYDQICQKCIVLRHTFHHHLIATSMDQQHIHLILQTVEQSFTQASFPSLFDVY